MRELVLIVGAGPTGLVLALWLVKAGVGVRIIDKSNAPSTTSRALVFHARNMEFYRQLGIEKGVLEQSIEFKKLTLWLRGKQIASALFGGDFGISEYSHSFIFPQDVHEQYLIEKLGALGVQVGRSTELLAFQETDSSVEATLRKPDGTLEHCSVSYLAGCDGAHSKVREVLHVGFDGGTYANKFYVADVSGSGQTFDGQMHVALDDADFVAVFPLKANARVRLVGSLPAGVSEKDDLEWSDLGAPITHRVGIQVEAVNWFSIYRVHHRVASRFQVGRAFLLGDAAHVHSPVGGQGMNTGIGDAVNLGWKLAAVLHGESPAAILATFEPERINFARRLVATTDRLFTVASSRGRVASAIRTKVVPVVIPALMSFQIARRMLYKIGSQTAISYPDSPLSRATKAARNGGMRLPWMPSAGEMGEDNYAVLGQRKWLIHLYGEAPLVLKTLCQHFGLELKRYVWTPEADRAGMRKNTAYLVRPDGHIAISAPSGESNPLRVYLERWRPVNASKAK